LTVNYETQQRLELLKLARQELNNQYIKDRADAYTQWNIDSDRVWRESGIKLPFPPPPLVPSETDVIAYALALYNAQNPPEAQPPTTEPVTASSPVQKEPVNAPIPTATIQPVEPIAPTSVAVDTPVETMPEVLPPPVPVVPQLVTITGAADRAIGEKAIKEIFANPSGAPAMVASETPAPSVVPLIKSMLKKGLLPSWIKADDADIKE